MWLLPSRGRPQLAKRLFDKGFKTPGVLILDEDDVGNYAKINLPEGWKVLVLERMFLSGKMNTALEYVPGCDWYGGLNDDHMPITEDWDLKLVEALKDRPFVWPKDNYGNRISTPVMRGELVRTLGWFCCPAMNHFYLDDVHELIAECLGCLRLESVTVSHEHVNAGRMTADTTYRERPSNEKDRQAFLKWCRDDWPGIREKLGC